MTTKIPTGRLDFFASKALSDSLPALHTITGASSKAANTWFCKWGPAILAQILPSKLTPSRVIPYESLSSPGVLQKHLLPATDPRYAQFQTLFQAMQTFDAVERLTTTLSSGFNRFVCIPNEIPDCVVKVQLNFGKKRMHAYVRKAHLPGESKDGNVLRVIMAKRMRGIIAEYHLDKLHVPRKWLFPLNSGSNPVDTDYAVIAEREELLSIEKSQEKMRQMPESEANQVLEQLYFLFYFSGYQDARSDNIRFNTSGKLVICDTEPLGMADQARHASSVDHVLGGVREVEIDCALYAMSASRFTHVGGLPFKNETMQEVGSRFLEMGNEEKKVNGLKRKALVGLCILIHSTVLASALCCAGRCFFQDPSDPQTVS